MSEPVSDRPPIPVTVVGGYLGAGKTTLLNHVLATAGERIAVLVNDYGDINIDAALIAGNEGDAIELANGCICCSLVDGFASALGSVLALSPPPDRLVVEASGVADPATVAAYAHTPGLILDAVVVVADAETIERRVDDRYVGDTVRAQLESADIVVANKSDLVAPGELGRVVAWLADRQPGAAVVEAERGVVPVELLFGAVVPGDEPRRAVETRGHAEFGTWSWRAGQPVSREAIDRAMAALPSGIWRVKGVVLVGVDARAHVLQRVGARWSLRPLAGRAAPAESTVVAIGAPDAIGEGWLGSHFGDASG